MFFLLFYLSPKCINVSLYSRTSLIQINWDGEASGYAENLYNLILFIGGQIIHTVKYADDLVLLAKEEKVLQDMIDKLIEIGRCYGIELNVEKTKVMRISRQPLPVKIIIDQKQLENVKSFKYLGSILTNDRRCTCEIKCRIAMAKAAFNHGCGSLSPRHGASSGCGRRNGLLYGG